MSLFIAFMNRSENLLCPYVHIYVFPGRYYSNNKEGFTIYNLITICLSVVYNLEKSTMWKAFKRHTHKETEKEMIVSKTNVVPTSYVQDKEYIS